MRTLLLGVACCLCACPPRVPSDAGAADTAPVVDASAPVDAPPDAAPAGCFVVPRPAGVAAGSVDTGFAGIGYATQGFTGAYTMAVAGAVQDDCRVLVGGYAEGLSFVARYLADGTLDASFGDAGVLELPRTDTLDFVLDRLLILPDGSILGVGFAGTASRRMALTHLGSDGAIDPSAAYGGVTLVSGVGPYGDPLAVGMDSLGRLILGARRQNGTNLEYVIVRAGLDGAADTTFGVGGETIIPGEIVARDLRVLPDDRIVVAGEHYGVIEYEVGAGAVELLPDGTINTGFGSAGVAAVLVESGVYKEIDRVELSGERLLLSGWTTLDPQRFLLVGVTDGGLLDTGFGVGGAATIDVGIHWGTELVVQPDGKIVVAGTGHDERQTLARFEPDGGVDTSFGTGGFAKGPGIVAKSYPHDLQIGPDGRLFVVGHSEANDGVTPMQGYVARFWL